MPINKLKSSSNTRRKRRAKVLRRLRKLGSKTLVGSVAREVNVLRNARGLVKHGGLARNMTARIIREGRRSGRI